MSLLYSIFYTLCKGREGQDGTQPLVSLSAK